MDSIKDVTKEEFIEAFNMLKIGNPEKAWNEFAYAVYNHKDFVTGQPVSAKAIIAQWRTYATICIRDHKDKRFIKSMDKWIKEKEYLTDYTSRGSSFLDKYKKK